MLGKANDNHTKSQSISSLASQSRLIISSLLSESEDLYGSWGYAKLNDNQSSTPEGSIFTTLC